MILPSVLDMSISSGCNARVKTKNTKSASLKMAILRLDAAERVAWGALTSPEGTLPVFAEGLILREVGVLSLRSAGTAIRLAAREC